MGPGELGGLEWPSTDVILVPAPDGMFWRCRSSAKRREVGSAAVVKPHVLRRRGGRRTENPMKTAACLAIAVFVLLPNVTPTWGGPPNPTQSDVNGNTAGGTNALAAVTVEGGSNTAFGFGALKSNTDGDTNTACGALALFHNTSGLNNTASGAFALLSNTTG